MAQRAYRGGEAADDFVVLPLLAVVDANTVIEMAHPDPPLAVAGNGVAVIIAESVLDGELRPLMQLRRGGIESLDAAGAGGVFLAAHPNAALLVLAE